MVDAEARRRLAVDAALGAGLMVLCGLVAVAYSELPDLVVLVLFGVALALRRVSPGRALAIAWVAALTQLALLRPPLPADVAVLVILHATAAYGEGRTRWWGLASAGVGAALAGAYLGFLLPGAGPAAGSATVLDRVFWAAFVFVGSLGVLALSWTTGQLARAVRASRDARHRAELDRRDREAAEQAMVVEQERTRIARDMHDIVAHSLAVVIAQADGARYAASRDPEAAASALATISSTARSALGEVRVLLASLRHAEGDAPQPALADVDELLERMRRSGLEVRRTGDGPLPELGPGTQLAAYRILQEALTNALRHGDLDRPVTVDLRPEEGGLLVAVENGVGPQPAPPAGGARHGLPGMRERAALVGGTLTAEPAGDGVFRVRAWLPAGEAA